MTVWVHALCGYISLSKSCLPRVPCNRVIEDSSDLMEESSSLNVSSLPSLMAIGIGVVEIILNNYQLASHDHVFKELWNFVAESLS